MVDYVDTCVFLAVIQEEPRAQQCGTYLNTVGYRQHPVGIISSITAAEMLFSVVKKLDRLACEKAAGLAADILFRLYHEGRISLLRGEYDRDLLENIRSIDFTVSRDDQEQIMAAILACCSRFVTIDSKLLRARRLQDWLLHEHRLRIVEP